MVLLLLIPLSGSAVTAVVLVALLGLTGMGVPPVATGLAVRFAHSPHRRRPARPRRGPGHPHRTDVTDGSLPRPVAAAGAARRPMP